MKSLVILLFFSIISLVSAHSWLECTDYRVQNETDWSIWNPSICFGRARCGDRQAVAGFGVDTGFNNQARTCQRCSFPTKVKIAKYRPGQMVCVAHPPKNHVAAPCTNPYIPDKGVNIFRTAVGAKKEVFVKKYNHLGGVHKNGVIDFKGYQNCPAFCNNMDKALCTMCFMLEKNIALGKYTFSWTWNFNPGEYYTTCWDAIVY